MRELEVKMLMQKVEKLLESHEELREQNQKMRSAEAGWQAERAKLIQQNEMARRKLNDMINRLQTLERNSG